MGINFKSRREIFISVIFAVVISFFVVVNLTSNSKDEPLFSKCFPGGSLLTTIQQPAGNTRVAKFGEAGYLTYGPYLDLNPGTYNVTLSYSAEFEGSNFVVGAVDRAESSGTIPGTEVLLVAKTTGDNEYSQSFEAKSRLAGFEFRVFANGKSAMEVKELCIKQTD
jgi:hypothetical protein